MPKDFSDNINFTEPNFSNTDLIGPYPSQKKQQKLFTAKYGKFILEESGNEVLEAIMNDCLAGKKTLVDEKWTSTKDGDTIVTIKYLIPSEPTTSTKIQGRRRITKANLFLPADPKDE